jgi:hypothetical protein
MFESKHVGCYYNRSGQLELKMAGIQCANASISPVLIFPQMQKYKHANQCAQSLLMWFVGCAE